MPVSFAGKPLVHGGILRFDGRVTTIIPKQIRLLSLRVQESAAAGARGLLSGSGSDRRLGRHHRNDSSD